MTTLAELNRRVNETIDSMNWLRTNDHNGPGEVADCLDAKGRTIRVGYYTNDAGRICTWIEREGHRSQSYAHQTPEAARRACATSMEIWKYTAW